DNTFSSGVREARVLTEAPAGPLYRVVGSPLYISCNVSGFVSESLQKEFEFRIVKPAKPDFEINIISTRDQSFSYAMYLSRVNNKNIIVNRLSPNSVLFEIKSLQKDDEGEYECTVINVESVYMGTYSAKTTVKVIDNSLSVSSHDATTMSYNEGDALTLTCQASSNTIQHTHLSFAWYLRRDGEDSAEIISLDRDFTLSAGQGFERRYQDGLIRLDKTEEATYWLKVAQLQLSDHGRIYCQAQEWIQDPDRSWYCITHKSGAEIAVNVKARDTEKLKERFFSVAWLRENVELAQIGPTGILSVGSEYSGREKVGELKAARTGDRDYRLTLQPVRTEDQGEYICRAWPQERGQDGAFTRGAAQDSSSQLVTISVTGQESGISVNMKGSLSVNEGDRLKLICQVDGVKGQLSVTWQHKPASTSTAQFTNVISLSQEGVMEKEGEFKSRKVTAARPSPGSFTLELDEVTPSDSGVYQCTVSEWKTSSKTSSHSQTAAVTVMSTGEVTIGENVELMCQVRGPQMPVTVTWSLQRDATTLDNILTMYYDGSISWSGDQRRYQLKVENQKMQVMHYLLINGATLREAGSYQCSVSVFLHNVHKKLPPSNLLAVVVQRPVSKLALTSPANLKASISTDIELKCSVAKKSSASSRYAVTWKFQHQAENKVIVSSDKDAVVTFGPQLDLRLRQRISTRNSQGPSFALLIRQAEVSENGSYTCEVAEWLQDPNGVWYQLSSTNRTTLVTLIEPANDLHLSETEEKRLVVKEGDEVELKCNIISMVSSPPSFYKVVWLYSRHSSSIVNVPLVELDHQGLLRYPESQALKGLQGRLHLSRPSQNSFYLGIQRAHEGDNGTYQCQVELYQLDHEGHWQQKASKKAGPVALTVNVTGMITSFTGNFTIPCSIKTQSSGESEFQVTWFWKKEKESRQRPIFTSYRNCTLQDRSEKDYQLRFYRPLPNLFNLTVLRPVPENSGLYFCEVEEWLPSLSHGWRKVAVEKSKYLAVNSDTWMWILAALLVCLLLVILVLMLKMCWPKISGGKKPVPSLWTEQLPLDNKPSAED
uniref:Ig-like domain-containing protein n=1 Tax=Anabas testudineus TaxID=64144 RepID=A0A3Q1IE71_ANATE